MSINFKKVSVITGAILGGLYVLFLISPVIVSPILNSYSEDIATFLKSSTGFDTSIDKLSFVTAPNLSAGVKIKHFSMSIPAAENPFISTENASARVFLLPFIVKKVQIANLSADKLNAQLSVKKDGSFLIQDYLVQKNEDENAKKVSSLPYGLKLSNHLPNVRIKNYDTSFVDAMTGKSYGIQGKNLKISDFILDKKFKFSTLGKVVFDNNIISNYDIKLYNKIMPDVQLDDIVFPKDTLVQDSEPVETPSLPFNIIDVLKTVNDNNFTADLTTNIKTSGTLKNMKLDGKLNIDALSVAVDGVKLPESYLNLNFKGKRTDIDSIFFTSVDESEKTQIIGNVKSGKNPSIDMTLRSNAKFNNLFRLVDSIAETFGVKDFETLSATGCIDADFNINSDLKKVSSNGYLKIVPSSIKYGLYNVLIDNITADVDMTNNNINIKKSGFSILSHPLTLTGTIKANSDTDLLLNADRLSLKGLLTALGQTAILKENDVNSGDVSLNAIIKGKLCDVRPKIESTIENINIHNKASNAKLTLSNALIKILYDGKNASGDIDINSLAFAHPSAVVSVPKTNIIVDSKDINIKNSYLMLNNSRIDVTGVVKNYMNDKMNINISASGNAASSDIVSFLPKEFVQLISYKGKLPIKATVTGNSKVQNISAEINADPNNYIALADLNVLKNQKTKVHTNIEIIGDSLTFSNTGISNNNSTIAKLTGGISKLYSDPKLNVNISVPNAVSFPIWGMKNSNITALGNVSAVGAVSNPLLRGTVNLTDISMKDIDFVISDLVADLSGEILNGSATAKAFKAGGITASDLSADFSLKNYSKFYLKDISAKSFEGKVSGNIAYSMNDSKIGIDLTGRGLNSTKAVEGAAGIKNALTGLLDFNAKLAMQGVTDKDIINSLKGDVDFHVSDGRFISIGRLENLVTAQNIYSNSILKSAVSAMTSASTLQEADKFKSIDGDLTLSNGSAQLTKILVSGPLMAYYVTGSYNILPNSAKLIILGRLDAKVVSLLGPLGELSAEKLLSYIPKFGAMTSKMLKQLTSDPANENTELIPALSGGSTAFRDFKVVFDGPVQSSSSVKSFKWLSVCDTTKMNIKDEIQNVQDAVKTNINTKVENAKTNAQNIKTNVNNIIETQKNNVQDIKNEFNQTKSDLKSIKDNAKQNSDNVKNLFKNVLKNSQTKMPPAGTVETPAAE